MFTGVRFVQLQEGVLMELVSDSPAEDAEKFTEFIRKFETDTGAQVPIVKNGDGDAVVVVGEDLVVPLHREVVKTLYRKPVFVIAIGDDTVGEEVARYRLVPEVILKELL